MDNNKYILSKNAIGIILIWAGPPLFYFIRSELHLGGGSITSGIFYLLSLFLLKNPLPTQLGYKPNDSLVKLGGAFYLSAIFYFLIHNFNTFSRVIDSVNIFITLVFFLLILRISNKVQKFIPFWLIVITLVINIALLFSVITNPNYVIGLRATVQLSKGEFSGNPGIYARNGLIGVVISTLFLYKNEIGVFKQNKKAAHYLAAINFLLSIVVILVTQTRMILLSLILITICFIFFIKRNSIKSEMIKLNKKFVLFSTIILATILEVKFNALTLFKTYIDIYWYMFNRALTTAFTFGENKNTEADASAMGRVDNINLFFKLVEEEKYNLIFGKGFNYRYMDIPILEVFVNLGIIIFFIYVAFIILIIINSLKALKSTSIFQNFLALINIQLLLSMISSGRPMDLFYCIIYAVLIRFLNVENNKTLQI